MAVIKRYSNRKLYNLDSKQYITLEEIASLIIQGVKVSVFDHRTGEEVTDLIFTQVILEKQKKRAGIISRSNLEQLIRNCTADSKIDNLPILYSARINQLTSNEIKRRLRFLVTNGKLSVKDAEILLSQLVDDFQKTGGQPESNEEVIFLSIEELEKFFTQWEIPSQEDLNILNNQIQELYLKLEKLY